MLNALAPSEPEDRRRISRGPDRSRLCQSIRSDGSVVGVVSSSRPTVGFHGTARGFGLQTVSAELVKSLHSTLEESTKFHGLATRFLMANRAERPVLDLLRRSPADERVRFLFSPKTRFIRQASYKAALGGSNVLSTLVLVRMPIRESFSVRRTQSGLTRNP